MRFVNNFSIPSFPTLQIPYKLRGMSKSKIIIIDYGSGNLRSAAKAFEKIAENEALDLDVIVSGKTEDVDSADYIVLPGQGAFGDCIKGLRAVDGMVEALESNVVKGGKPFLGVCVGMQLMASRGQEGGLDTGLDWIDGEVRPLQLEDPSLKIPHMGWNELLIPSASEAQDNSHFVLRHVKPDTHFYFVHSYEFQCTNMHHILAFADYGGLVPAVVGRDNMIGCQFHPEKSHEAGLRLISDFLQWKP